MGYLSFQWSKWAGEKILRKNLEFTTFFVFWTILSDTLVPWSPWVTRYTGGLCQPPVVEISWGKNSKKKLSVLTNFCFLVNFVRHIGPMVTMVTWHTEQKTKVAQLHMTPKLWKIQLQLWFNLLSPPKLKPPLVTLSQLELDSSDLSLVQIIFRFWKCPRIKENIRIFVSTLF